MRLWSLNPKYLDRQGLLATWREALLAKKVLAGKTKGYVNHPQLIRFRESKKALENINAYLYGIYLEASARGYKFTENKIEKIKNLKIFSKKIKVSSEQIIYEFSHLLNKLKIRDAERYQKLKNLNNPQAHFLFKIVPGKIAKWEKLNKK
jgi:hypothetical protein